MSPPPASGGARSPTSEQRPIAKPAMAAGPCEPRPVPAGCIRAFAELPSDQVQVSVLQSLIDPVI